MGMKHIQGSKPQVYNGVKYKSKLEAEFAEIFDKYGIHFEYEKYSFQLIPTIRYNGETLSSCSYTPDFFLDNHIIIEAKGRPDAKWYLRKRLFILKYIIETNYEWEFYEIHTKKQLINFIEELKSREGKPLEVTQLTTGSTRKGKKDVCRKTKISKRH